MLGKLTNVTLLFDAAREANRRRLEVMGDLKRAEANLSALTEAAQKFRGMKDRQAAVSEAEEALERAHQLTVRVGRLQVLTGKLEAAQAALEAAVPPEVPDGAGTWRSWLGSWPGPGNCTGPARYRGTGRRGRAGSRSSRPP